MANANWSLFTSNHTPVCMYIMTLLLSDLLTTDDCGPSSSLSPWFKFVPTTKFQVAISSPQSVTITFTNFRSKGTADWDCQNTLFRKGLSKATTEIVWNVICTAVQCMYILK